MATTCVSQTCLRLRCDVNNSHMCSDCLVYEVLRSLIAIRHHPGPAREENIDKRRVRNESVMEFLHDLYDQINIAEPTRKKHGEPHTHAKYMK